MADHRISRFMGGSPGQVLLRLVFLSFVVGIILSALDLNPLDIFNIAINFFERLWQMGFDALGNIGRYFLLGAAVVVPIWLVLRVLAVGRGER
ncbi:MAG: integrase [Rhodobacteraceae bacterium]|nr:integrase [Paracoccaceae bacterium]